MDERLRSNLYIPRKFYLFGTPIQQSLSPSMHNGAYRSLLLLDSYHLAEQSNVVEYKSLMKQIDFGGASVTIPHKESIIPLIDEVRGAAKDIGAVNTIVVEGGHKLIGYNTDWIGIQRPILRKLMKLKTSVDNNSNSNNNHNNNSNSSGNNNNGYDSATFSYSGYGLVVGAGNTY